MAYQKHVVVIGAGFAGLMAAIRLAGRMKKGDAKITLINASEEYVVRPRLFQVAVNHTRKRQQIRDMLKGTGIDFVKGWVTRLEPRQNQVVVQTDAGEQIVSYDYLVYALGSMVDQETVAGVKDHAYVLNPSGERGADALRQRLLMMSSGKVVVVGSGATGIEVAAHIKAVYPQLEVAIFARDRFAGVRGSAEIDAQIRESLQGQGVQILSGQTVKQVDSDAIVLGDGQRIAYDVCIWAGGFIAPKLAQEAGLPVNARRQLLVDPYLRVQGYDNIYGVGDSAIPIEDAGAPYRMCCPVATNMGAHTADNLVRVLNGREQKPFSFGYMTVGIQLGRRDAIGWLTTPDDRPTQYVTRYLPAVWIRAFILWSLDIVYALEKQFPGAYGWVGKERYQQQQAQRRLLQIQNQSAMD